MQPGDRVQQDPAGPVMRVIARAGSGDAVLCQWRETDGRLRSGTFLAGTLVVQAPATA